MSRQTFTGILALLFALLPVILRGHALTITQVEATFAQPGRVDVRIAIDLTPWLGPAGYRALAAAAPAAQAEGLAAIRAEVTDGLQLWAGATRLQPAAEDWLLPRNAATDFDDPTIDKYTVLRFSAALPADGGPLRLVARYDTRVPHPVAFTVSVPATGTKHTELIEESGNESEPFAWAGLIPAARPPWWRELATWLRAGFGHIVPEGADHILFVLGLFFLGLTWRKLLAQTTVFTVAHATTLFLSSYGVFRLSARWVEPAIALSIAFIALENVRSPKLSPLRLAVVFGFGLVHGLGFAGSLAELPLPRDGFLLALLGFNFGVDFGQLAVIGTAFLAVGWFRNREWFRARVAIPCSLILAATGLVWAAQRIYVYWIR